MEVFIQRNCAMDLAYLKEVSEIYIKAFSNEKKNAEKKTILFLPTNGTGLGHMTRLLAIAKWVSKIDHDTEIVFFTTSYGYQEILEEGFTAYYFPSRDLCTSEVISSLWNRALEQSLKQVVSYYKPDCLVFDGTFPYLGIITALSVCKDIKKIWVKRGNNKIEDSEKVKRKESYFDRIVEPGEVGLGRPNKENYYYCNPILYLSKEDILGREDARKILGIPSDAIAVYVQLGAGKINQIEADINTIIEAVEKSKEAYVVIGESIIGKTLNLKGKNIKVIREYPNAKYFNAFDVAFSAAGYNTFHELIYFSVPTIFIPNQETQKDNQVSRAENAKSKGAAEVIYECEKQAVEKAFNNVLENNQNMRQNASELIHDNGGAEVARLIIEIMGESDEGVK